MLSVSHKLRRANGKYSCVAALARGERGDWCLVDELMDGNHGLETHGAPPQPGTEGGPPGLKPRQMVRPGGYCS